VEERKVGLETFWHVSIYPQAFEIKFVVGEHNPLLGITCDTPRYDSCTRLN